MPTLKALVFQIVLLVGRFEVFEPVNHKNNNTVETSNFAVVAFLV
jgi:hypothetical protein